MTRLPSMALLPVERCLASRKVRPPSTRTLLPDVYKRQPQSGHSLTNYVGAKAFFEAIANAKSTDKDKIRAAVLAYKKPAGQTANGWAFDFGEDGQNNASTFYVMQWQDGKLVTIAPDNLALGKPVFKK